jgi:hypothetical protein
VAIVFDAELLHRAVRIANAFIGLAFDERRHERLIARIVPRMRAAEPV